MVVADFGRFSIILCTFEQFEMHLCEGCVSQLKSLRIYFIFHIFFDKIRKMLLKNVFHASFK